ncbi:unnamed protein product, partial [Mesorhabditis belari]|uniref:Lipoprotein n=1 Tax=Mesorhabditis belari TaxID=2138241 RepID=A0AAF3EIM0_9BILA
MQIVRGLLLTIACLIVVATCRRSEETVKSQDGRPKVTKEDTTVSFGVLDRQIDADLSCSGTFEISPNSSGFLLYPGWIDDPPSIVLTSELTQRGDVRMKIDSRDTDFWVLYVTDTLNKDGSLMATGYHWFSLPRNEQDGCEYEFYSGSIPVPNERSTDSKLFLLKTKWEFLAHK